ncbi:MAG: hypothetical protein QOI35_3834, partial [Cryptosporangiaceae bacterium]|nr:hypothetical protein [Cryptosporangiaceae bacterium]
NLATVPLATWSYALMGGGAPSAPRATASPPGPAPQTPGVTPTTPAPATTPASAATRRPAAAPAPVTAPAPAATRRPVTAPPRSASVGAVAAPPPAGATATLPAGAARRYGAQVWAAETTLTYSFTGMTGRPSVVRQYLTYVRRDGRWYVGGDDDLAAQGQATTRDPWDFGTVAVLRSAQGLVLGDPAEMARLTEVRNAVDSVAPQVRAVWPEWPGSAIVVVARSDREAAAMVPGVGDLSQTAAVTAGELGHPAGERVVVNPVPFRGLPAAARSAVLGHELTHVATARVTSASTPLWLSEGFADYVANRGRADPPPQIARELAAAVRSGRVPELLPGEGDFDPSGPRLSEAYDGSWLACRLVADRAGVDGLVRLYRIVSADPGDPDSAADAGLRSVLGLSTEQFTALWRSYLRRQLA